MRVLVVGGYGLIGAGVLARLAADGHALAAAGRDVRQARRRFPAVDWFRIDLASAGPEDWTPALAGVDAVVNCAGALQEGPGDRLAKVHAEGLKTLAAACRAAGVRRLVHISAAGVAASPGPFGATKREGEAALAATDLDWIVLRPGLVLAPQAFGGSALLRALAAFPFAIPVLHADAVVQVVAGRDVAAAVAAAIGPEAPSRLAIDLVAAEPTTLAEILKALRGWLGLAPAPLLRVPAALARAAALVADALAWLGWKSPMRSTSVAQLAAGVRGEAGAAERALGVRMRPLAELLAADPAGVQDRWFAALYLLKPLVVAGLAGFWLLSGLIGFWRADAAATVLAEAGFDPASARLAVLAGAAADVALGAAACHRRTARPALYGMLAVTAAYLAGATLWRPDLWADPLGPLVKSLPAAILALVALALLPER